MFELLEKLALALDAEMIPYMVIGGQAVLLYGEPRLTRDIDITLGIDVDQLPKIKNLCARLGLIFLVSEIDAFTQRTFVAPTMEPKSGIRVDWIFSSFPYERQAMKRTRSVPMGAAQVRFASLEDLIVHKVLAGRPRDIEDLRGILRKHPSYDDGYLQHWLSQFDQALETGLVEKWKDLLSSLEDRSEPA